jgi:hypothetical protein
MALPSSGNITLQQIQTEFGTIGLAASAVAGIPNTSLVGSNLQPDRSMRDFLGRSANSVTLTINDATIIGGVGGTYQWGYTFESGLGSLSPNSSFLWGGTITGLYSYRPASGSGLLAGTFIDFSESQFYTGPYYITYRGTKYTLTATSGSDPYTWYTPTDNIFNGYGSGTVVISTQ